MIFTRSALIIFLLNSILGLEVFEDQIVPNSNVEDDVCRPDFCKTPSISDKLKDFCDRNGFTIEYRCCVNKALNDSNIFGIDYMGCYIEKLSNTVGILNREKIRNVKLLDVRNNTLEECGNLKTYSGFVNLNELYLSDYSENVCDCPGGKFSWTQMNNGSCIGRKNLCGSNFSPNINCTETSYCIENGPGNFLCECKPNYHGYKCLEEGEFPTLIFTLTICLSTMIGSGFLWHTQRRYVR